MFPQISTLSDLVPHIEHNKQIRVKPDELTGHIVVCYMVQDEDTFAGTDLQFACECRGITFHPDGKIAARTLHKFFNVGEHDSVQPWAIDWSKVTRIMEKRDGSMATPVWVNAGIKFKTKKTFTSEEAMNADKVAYATPNGVDWIIGVLAAGMTPTFEFTSPRFPIVIKYEKDELTLLHIRENVSGRYLTEEELVALDPPFPIVQNLITQFMDIHMEMGCFADDQVSWAKLETAAMMATGIEGWVIQFEDGNMVKLKTKWYCELHHAVTFTRWRDIARTVVADQSDDLKGAFAMTGRSIQPILEVERKIKERIDFAREAAQQIVDVFAQVGAGDAKSLALSVKNHPHMGIIMKVFRKQEIDWMAWYAKNHLDNDWSLEVVEVNA
jgi:RNA ligase